MLRRATIALSVLTLFFLASYLIFAVASASEDKERKPIPGHIAVESVDAMGIPHALAQWKGDVIVMNFWATWCAPCREEIPELSKIHSKFKSKGAVVVGISLDDSAKIKEFIQQGNPITYPILAADMDGMPYSMSLGNRSMVVPYTVILDNVGNIAHTYYGRINPAQIEQEISKLLKNPSLQH